MPIYEFECQNCGELVEKLFLTARPQEIDCPHCHGTARRIISIPNVFLDTVENVPWLRDFAMTRKEVWHGKKPPIATRTEYKQYLKDNNLRPADGINLSEV